MVGTVRSVRKRIAMAAIALGLLLCIGTASFYYIEHWSLMESFYFTGITLTTIGYGDMTPRTDLGKIFTVFFAFSAVGIAAYYISILAESRTIIAEESKRFSLQEIDLNEFSRKVKNMGGSRSRLKNKGLKPHEIGFAHLSRAMTDMNRKSRSRL